jgi:hypothetical protein
MSKEGGMLTNAIADAPGYLDWNGVSGIPEFGFHTRLEVRAMKRASVLFLIVPCFFILVSR